MTDRRSKQAFWLYAGLSLAFWVVIASAGWEFTSGKDSLRIGWEGAVLNLALLLPLWRHVVLVWHLLAFQSLVAAIVFASALGETYGLLGFVAAAQFLLLWRMRTPRSRAAEPRSTY